MLARQLIPTNLRSVTCGILRTPFSSTSPALSMYDEDKHERAERKLKGWRKPVTVENSLLQLLNNQPKKTKPSSFFRNPLKPYNGDIKQWWKSQTVNYKKYTQGFMQNRHEVLGCDLAAAHFIVYRNGKVKFLGKDEWIEKKGDGTYNLPDKYDPYWQLTHVDASDLEIYYEGLCNFINLGQVKWASFKGNPTFNDWSLDKIIAQMPRIEYLDVSECKMLTERGVGALCRLYNLKTVIVTDWKKLPSFELTCIMLEDVNPELKITIMEPENSPRKLKY